MVACLLGHPDIVELLLSQDKDGKLIKLRNVHGQTAKDFALLGKHDQIISQLDSWITSQEAKKKSQQ